MNTYPFKIKTFDPLEINIFQRLEQQRLADLPSDRTTSMKLTWKLKPIRPDIFIGRDSRYHNSIIGLKPFLNIETQHNGNGLEVIFSKKLANLNKEIKIQGGNKNYGKKKRI